MADERPASAEWLSVRASRRRVDAPLAVRRLHQLAQHNLHPYGGQSTTPFSSSGFAGCARDDSAALGTENDRASTARRDDVGGAGYVSGTGVACPDPVADPGRPGLTVIGCSSSVEKVARLSVAAVSRDGDVSN